MQAGGVARFLFCACHLLSESRHLLVRDMRSCRVPFKTSICALADMPWSKFRWSSSVKRGASVPGMAKSFGRNVDAR